MYAAFPNSLASTHGVDAYVRETAREPHRSPPDVSPWSGRSSRINFALQVMDTRCARRTVVPASQSSRRARAARRKCPGCRGGTATAQTTAPPVGVLVASQASGMRLALDLEIGILALIGMVTKNAAISISAHAGRYRSALPLRCSPAAFTGFHVWLVRARLR